jgi:hypothetical protein
MAQRTQSDVRRLTNLKDARGRRTSRLDPVALHLLGRHDTIPADALRDIAAELDPKEVKWRRWAAVAAPFWVILCYAGFFGYFRFFSRWKGWDPVLITFAAFYFVFPFASVYWGFRKARRARLARIQQIMLKHLRCPHCGYDIRGLPADPVDGATVCPECGCAWTLENSPATGGQGIG